MPVSRVKSRLRRSLAALVLGTVGGVLLGCVWQGRMQAAAASGQAVASDLIGEVANRFVARDKRKLSHKSDSYREARRNLPETFREYQTKRFIVLSDAQPNWTKRQANLLERTYHQYRRFTRRIKAEPQGLRHKLVCVLFHEYDDYRNFARTQDNVTADWISGYYSPKFDRVVFYNIETNPEFSGVLELIGEKSLASTGDLGVNEHDHGACVAGRLRVREDFERAATATVIHECVHQLSFHTRLQTPHLQNPLWLSEGLATAFETGNPKGSFGPDKPYDLREEMFQELLADDKLIPLRDLVTYSRMPSNDDDTIAAVYHQSYSLLTWLSRFRKKELNDFFDRLRNEPPGRPTPERHHQLFVESFGDIRYLEKMWLRHVNK